jgi:hypothetical protein
MAGTPAAQPRVVKDYGQPKKFLKDMRARAAKNSHSQSRTRKRT